MIKLIVGNKGSGKTKTMITMANEAVATTKGNVICIEKGIQLTYDLNYQVRLVDVEQYGVAGYEPYFGFLCGLMAGNYDITHIFCDATLRVCGSDLEALGVMIDKLEKLAGENIELVFTLSCELGALPERIRKFAV